MKSIKFRFFDMVVCAAILSVGVQMTVSCEDIQPEDGKSIYQGSFGGGNPVDLSSSASANCYIVSSAGNYSFRAVKGNSSVSVGAVACAVVLWESFGTSSSPSVGDLISSVSYEDGYIRFRTAETFKEGNAVIAAKDVEGNILWSWHIWMTDVPEGQEYYNDAGVMMDRNLGATSSVPGDVGALGLFYQWGRKDPFLGSASIYGNVEAKSTVTWPSSVKSDSNTSTIEYVISNPMTFICGNGGNDWTSASMRPDALWTTSETTKSIYDPCPVGWRVPDGGENGVWSKAQGYLGGSYECPGIFDMNNRGVNFSVKFGYSQIIWYPTAGGRIYNGCIEGTGEYGCYLSASTTPVGSDLVGVYYFYFSKYNKVSLWQNGYRDGGSVRCVQE